MTKLCMLAGLLVGLPSTPFASPNRSQKAQLEALGNRIDKSVRALKSLSYSVTGKVEITVGGGSVAMPVTSTVQIKRPNLFKVENSADFGGSEHRNLLMCNGRTVWEYNSSANTYTEQPLKEVASSARGIGRWFTEHGLGDPALAIYLEGIAPSSKKQTPGTFDAVSYTRKAVDGRDTYVIQMAGSVPGAGPGRLTLYIDAKDLTVTKSRTSITLRNQGQRKQSITIDINLDYSDFETNLGVLDDAFRFDPPEGAHQVSHMIPLMREALSGQ